MRLLSAPNSFPAFRLAAERLSAKSPIATTCAGLLAFMCDRDHDTVTTRELEPAQGMSHQSGTNPSIAKCLFDLGLDDRTPAPQGRKLASYGEVGLAFAVPNRFILQNGFNGGIRNPEFSSHVETGQIFMPEMVQLQD